MSLQPGLWFGEAVPHEGKPARHRSILRPELPIVGYDPGTTTPTDPTPTDPTPTDPGELPSSPDRYTGPWPDRGSILSYLQKPTAPGPIGNIVLVPPGTYTAASFQVVRTGTLTLVAAEGDGSVRIKGVMRLDGELGINFIGFDMDGQWSIQQNGTYRGRDARVRGWYGDHKNPGRLGYAGYDKQPAVFQLHSPAQEFTWAGGRVHQSAQDLIKITSGKKVLFQGMLCVDTKWNWGPDETYHSDGFQVTGAASFKLLDMYFPEDSRIQIGQENSYPARGYIARSWFQGVPSFEITLGQKGQPDGPHLVLGEGVYVAKKLGDYSSADKSWRWGSKYGPFNEDPTSTITGKPAIFEAPPGYDASPTKPARAVSSSPEKVWMRANPFPTWQDYFSSAKSTFSGAEGSIASNT